MPARAARRSGRQAAGADRGRSDTLDGANVTSFESLNKQGAGTLILTGDHSYTRRHDDRGRHAVARQWRHHRRIVGNVTNNGTLVFDLGQYTLLPVRISGAGSVTNKIGTGVTTLTGNNSYTGATNVNAGTLLINGNQSAATGLTSVASGATLGGSGHHRRQRDRGRWRRSWRRRQSRRLADDQRQSVARQRLGSQLRVRPGECRGRPAQRSRQCRRQSDARRHAQRQRDARRQLRRGRLSRLQLWRHAHQQRANVASPERVRPDLGRRPGQPGQFGRPDAELLGRQCRAEVQRRRQWRQRHLAARRRQRQLDRHAPAA